MTRFIFYASLACIGSLNFPVYARDSYRVNEEFKKIERYIEAQQESGKTPTPGLKMMLNETNDEDLQLTLLANLCIGNNYMGNLQAIEYLWLKSEISSVRVFLLLIVYNKLKHNIDIFPDFEKLALRFSESESRQRLKEIDWVKTHYKLYRDDIGNIFISM